MTALTGRATRVARLDVTPARTAAHRSGGTVGAVVGAAVDRAAARWAWAPVDFLDGADAGAPDGSHVAVTLGAPRPVLVRGADAPPALRAMADVAAHGDVPPAALGALLELVAEELHALPGASTADDGTAAR